jgi:hypothetical protein
MRRSQADLRVGLNVLVMLTAAAAIACSAASQERQALIEFFEAARLRDLTVLGNLATVSFDPKTDGSVQHFDIERVADTAASKEVTILAQVRKPGGQMTPERMVVTMQRGGSGRWIITRLRASRTSPVASSAPPT